MSYDIAFRVKVEGVDAYLDLPCDCEANITWNVQDIITKSTGLEWKNEQNNGYVKDIIPFIEKGLHELETNGEQYKQYEAPNGWGTVKGTMSFFRRILQDWYALCEDYQCSKFKDVVTFWIV